MMKMKPAPILSRVSSQKEIKELIEKDQIASISIRLPVSCNLDCRDCYSSKSNYGNYQAEAISYNELEDTLEQAFSLGARSVSFVGDGEPLIYKTKEGDIFSLIDFVNSYNREAFLFTNQTLITPKIANLLFSKNLTIIGKQNTLDPEKQARYFIRTPSAQESFQKGIENLISAGFNKTNPSRLALHSIIQKSNYDEIPQMWRIWREQNIIPYLQVDVPPIDPESQERFNQESFVSANKLRQLFELLLKIDENEFGYTWDVEKTYPIPAMGCSLALSGCGISPQGNVQICSYTEIPLGNVKEESLREILLSENVKEIRRHKYHEMESGNLYGCRCLAFALTHDRYARDPVFEKFVRPKVKNQH